MRYAILIGTFCGLAACSTGGSYDGVPLDQSDTLTCPNIPGEVSAPGVSARDSQLRCTPQSQPLTSS